MLIFLPLPQGERYLCRTILILRNTGMHRKVPDRHRHFARTMRADATMAETVLWQAIRNRQLDGFKFKRQVPLDGYILDFVCFDARLIIEVDGFQHAENRRDLARDTFFCGQGFRILRFWNEEVVKNLDAVCLAILAELRNTGD